MAEIDGMSWHTTVWYLRSNINFLDEKVSYMKSKPWGLKTNINTGGERDAFGSYTGKYGGKIVVWNSMQYLPIHQNTHGLIDRLIGCQEI